MLVLWSSTLTAFFTCGQCLLRWGIGVVSSRVLLIKVLTLVQLDQTIYEAGCKSHPSRELSLYLYQTGAFRVISRCDDDLIERLLLPGRISFEVGCGTLRCFLARRAVIKEKKHLMKSLLKETLFRLFSLSVVHLRVPLQGPLKD
jgi:hypothetical protein